MHATRRMLRSERGAVFAQVGIAVFVLMAFNVFVLDYGMMWVGRRQAQNAADAGALAGAVALGYDDPPPTTTVAAEAAGSVASTNLIWQQPPDTPDVSFPTCPPGVTGRCVRVAVTRNMETLFGPILGINTQAVGATATAIAANGNATACLRPFAFADQWTESGVTPPGEFNGYVEPGGGALPSPDLYTPPDATQAVSYTVGDLGHLVTFSYDQPPLTSPITEGLLLPLALPGTNTYEQNIGGCNGRLVALRDSLDLASPAPGSTRTELEALFAQDASANWDPVNSKITNSCAPGCAPISPRLIAIAVYDPDKYQYGRATPSWGGCTGPCISVSNIIGFFINGLTSTGGHGYFVRYPGTKVVTKPTIADDGSWLVAPYLIR
jgi:hypothetical protein